MEVPLEGDVTTEEWSESGHIAGFEDGEWGHYLRNVGRL